MWSLYLNGLSQIQKFVLRSAAALFLLLPGVILGAEYTVKSSINQDIGYDTNVRMLDDAEGSFFYKITPVLSFGRKTDITEVNAHAMYGTQIYPDVQGFDQDFQNYSLDGLYRTEMMDFELDLRHSSTPTRNNALQDSGNFSASSTNTTQTISPTITFKISEIDSLKLSSSYAVTKFSGQDTITSNFRNNTSTNIDINWQRMWTERYSSGLAWFYSIFESDDGGVAAQQGFNFDSYGLNFSNTYLLSQKWTLNGTIGIRQTESDDPLTGASTSSVGFLTNLEATYSSDNLDGGFSFQRSLQPSAQGRLQEQSGVNLFMTYRIVERLSARLNFNYTDSTQINQQLDGARTNITLQPSINWELTPEWTLSGSYRLRMQDNAQDALGNPINSSRSAESHLFMISINFNWQGLSISR